MTRLAALAVLALLTLTGCEALPRLKVHAEGSPSDVDWSVGVPF